MTFNKRKLSQVCAGALLAGGLVVSIAPVVAATAAGTLIKNLATVTYEDSAGNTYSAQSNEAVITVKQVYKAEIASDADKTATAGQMVYIQHTLTNNGNGSDTYSLDATNDISVIGNINSNSVKVYRDLNGNGLVDAGEPEVTNVTLAAGASAELVIAVAVPSSATTGQKLGVILTATSLNDPTAATNPVIDATDATGGIDKKQGTNQDLITISGDAVLNYTKSAVLNAATNQITYTLTITNTGNRAATNVNIYDAIPTDKNEVPMTLVSTSAQGLLAANGDTEPVAASHNEITLGIDVNNDGDKTDTVVAGIKALDASIAPNQTVSVNMVVQYDPATFNNNAIAGSAGDIVKNTAWLQANLDGNTTTTEKPIPSNPTQTVLPQKYAVDANDTDENKQDTINDGLDDDGDNDIQYVTQAPISSSVQFMVDVTNNGSGTDTFELSIAKGNFPTGTTFTIWNQAGTVQLTDTNSEAGVDTGPLAAGATTTFMVKAQLPSTVTGNNAGAGFTATLTATSANDPAATPASNTTNLQLGTITSSGVDITENADGFTLGVDKDELGSSPYTINNGNNTTSTNKGSRPTFNDATVGSQVEIPFYIDNDSGSADAFKLSAGGSDGTTLGALPTGWKVAFYATDAAGNRTGSPITTTPSLPAGTATNADRKYIAVVSIPTDPANAAADYGTVDTNGDGDGDQLIFIRVLSSATGATDTMMDAIDVKELRQVALTPPGADQIQAGGSVDYTHTLDNTGNTEETFEISATNPGTTPNWNNNLMVDTTGGPNGTGDGIPDKPISQLLDTDKIYGMDNAGNIVPVTWTDIDKDKNPEVTLPPGVSMPLTPVVFAPSDADPGEVNTLTVTATNTDTATNAPDASVEDISTVILGQVRLVKTVAYDAACDGTADGAFAANLTSKVAPGECAIWQIVAENQGDASALKVVVRDTVPTYTTYKANSLMYALDNSTLITRTDAENDDSAEQVNGTVSFFIGSGATSDVGGTLVPGQTATVQFSTKVD